MKTVNYNLKTRETSSRVLNRIIQIHNTPVNSKKMILLVEGHYDVEFYKMFCDLNHVRIHYTSGSENMDEVVPLLVERHYEYLAIQDSDFKHFGQQKSSYDNLFFTDFHDYEMTCFSDVSFAQKFSDEVIDAYGWQIDYALIDAELVCLSCYKAVNMINGYNVSFKMLDTYISEYEVLGHEEIQRHLGGNLQPGVVNGFMRSNPYLTDKRCHLHNGHDFLNRICYHIGKSGQYGVDEEDLQNLIGDTYTEDDFHKTKLYNDVVLWETSHRKVWK